MKFIQHCLQTPAIVIKGETNERKKEKANRVGNKNGNTTFCPQITSMLVSIENTMAGDFQNDGRSFPDHLKEKHPFNWRKL